MCLLNSSCCKYTLASGSSVVTNPLKNNVLVDLGENAMSVQKTILETVCDAMLN